MRVIHAGGGQVRETIRRESERSGTPGYCEKAACGTAVVDYWLRGLALCRQVFGRKYRVQQPLATKSAWLRGPFGFRTCVYVLCRSVLYVVQIIPI